MARTVRIRTESKPVEPGIVITDYKGFKIETVISSQQIFVELSEGKKRVRNFEHAKQLIDGMQKDTDGPYGGYMQHPPISCKFKVKDKESYWVDCSICALKCVDVLCATYIKLMEGRKNRIKLLDSYKLALECPYCKMPVKEVSKDLVTTIYTCGTTGNKITKEYERICKPQTQRRRR